ncbi:MAG: hypothetical protein OEL88_14250 [Sterolibacteriaceae bacterium MAG5]|nr:hypothetical protein [Candidatus Nitricoxidireducens bremensis]
MNAIPTIAAQPLRLLLILAALAFAVPLSAAESRNLAPGFTALPKGASLLVMQPDIELFSISAGGVTEPKADWTEQAGTHIHDALRKKSAALGLKTLSLSEAESDELAEVNSLHGAVARSIALHHMVGGNFALPTKDNKLDWSLGDAVRPIREKSGADYALFIWMRDSYASAERKVTMVALALLGVGVQGGLQTGYASLVDLRTGQVMWFNRLLRGTGDLREPDAAVETVATLLDRFPDAR